MYIYQADVYCDKCGEQICELLQRAAKLLNRPIPSDPDDTGSYDSDDYPKGPFSDDEEADTPQHCGGCQVFLENQLTSDGYDYVVEQATEDFAKNEQSEVISEWLQFYNLEYESEPYFDRFDICEAYYLFASLYHGGQGSKEYKIFGRLKRMDFEPSRNGVTYEGLSENARGIYMRLAAKAEVTHHA